MFSLHISDWVSSALLLTLALGGAYVMWALVSENRDLKSEIAQLRAHSSILGTSLSPGDALHAVPLTDLYGRAASLPELLPHGGIVAFLTTTCPFCKETLPAWHGLAESSEASGLPFIGVSLDDADQTRLYAKEMGVSWPLWVPANALAASAELKVPLVPMTVLMGPGNVVQGVWPGVLSDDDVRALQESLESQLLTMSVLPGSPGIDPGCCEAPVVGTTAGS